MNLEQQTYVIDTGSFLRVFDSIRRLRSISPAEKLILSSVMSYDLSGETCHLTNKQMSDENGVSVDTVKRTLDSLQDKGFIVRSTFQTTGTKRSRQIFVSQNVIYKRLKAEKESPDGIFEDV